MHKYFMEKYAMSELGAKNLGKSILSHTLLNLSKLFPPIVGFMFLFQYLGSSILGSSVYEISLQQYLLIIFVMFVVMFLVARWDYVNLYENVYSESERSRIDIANRLKKLPLSYFGKRDLSDLSATIMSDVELYETIFSHSVPHLYSTFISTAIISVLILFSNFKLGIAVLWVIPVALLIYNFSRKSQQKAFGETLNATRAVYDDVQEKLDQIQEIKSYSMEVRSTQELSEKLDFLSKMKIKTELAAMIGIGVSTVILKLGIVSVAVVGANMLIHGEINILLYIGYLMMSASIYTPIEGLMSTLSMIMMMDKVVERIKEIKTMPIQEGKTQTNIHQYDIEFKNVVFGYEDQLVIDKASFSAKQGEITALIGSSGSGKTTLTKLAARFWDIDDGQILLGGEDISHIDPETLLKNFAIVFQDVVLFNASIKENIRIGKKGATDEEVMRAAKIARCDEFFERMPQGIDSLIGENGERLSGGERQRISIARAILKDAPIILLDEATASLDVENESLIQEALSELMKDKTVIVIAHRMRTIKGADKIVVLEKGKIESIGSHEELVQNSPIYRRMIDKSGA
ncbi:MAG: ABC transporter ATP-binding protein [Peptostreptococcaceae bacterium]|nr:ABC transporter ATP-binding protein [Peptostreptococcaceae bacterium]